MGLVVVGPQQQPAGTFDLDFSGEISCMAILIKVIFAEDLAVPDEFQVIHRDRTAHKSPEIHISWAIADLDGITGTHSVDLQAQQGAIGDETPSLLDLLDDVITGEVAILLDVNPVQAYRPAQAGVVGHGVRAGTRRDPQPAV